MPSHHAPLPLTPTSARKRKKKKSKPRADYNPYESRDTKVMLSDLLNFIKGLWSTCGGKRVIVFTTNHVDNLDPALVCRGRMDMHIQMSYCRFKAFKTLTKNYLGIHVHRLFDAVEEQLKEVKITPVDVAKCLLTAK
ncbi:hypothetical protein PR202_ga28048 [Eleusine coracana subsp. coracana]|uniref:ATPase AAA-type core domain-containing protein n=1 Tax=Eleusine coracana subsp. coracana TaxID=191504 RepID=A0AAV5DII5_ELECO|nr:hypothetical protein PR202_ga28048 [Eleusine coracana subsp. coracana]